MSVRVERDDVVRREMLHRANTVNKGPLVDLAVRQVFPNQDAGIASTISTRVQAIAYKGVFRATSFVYRRKSDPSENGSTAQTRRTTTG